MSYETIILEKTDRIATITLNRPRAMNAINRKMLREIQQAVGDIRNNSSVKVVETAAPTAAPSVGAKTPTYNPPMIKINSSSMSRLGSE